MRVDDLCEAFRGSEFPAQGVDAHPDRASVKTARSAVESAVIDEEFLVDCMRRELRLIEANTPRRGLTPFFIIPDFGIRIAFGYWPPGATPGAHEHTAWTITAVCRNRLEVLTYDREESYKRQELVPRNRFNAGAGRVGYIYEPSIHKPKNISTAWSMSLHVSSPRDGQPLADDDRPFPAFTDDDLPSSGGARLTGRFPAALEDDRDDPQLIATLARRQRGRVRGLTRVLAEIDMPGVPELLARCFVLADPATRDFIARMDRRIPHISEPDSMSTD
jgi:hypothetical protein